MENLVLGALSNPTRLKLLRCLSKGKKNVAELIGTCGLAQSAVSQHLTKLKNAGLISDEKQGKFVYYSLVYPKVTILAQQIEKFIKEVEKKE